MAPIVRPSLIGDRSLQESNLRGHQLSLRIWTVGTRQAGRLFPGFEDFRFGLLEPPERHGRNGQGGNRIWRLDF